MIQNLLQKVDKILLGGAMIFTFYKAKDYEIGKSLFDEHNVIMAKMIANNEKILLPVDVVIANEETKEANIRTVEVDSIPPDTRGLDIGERSVQSFKELLKDAKTVIWNGPLGYIEVGDFAKATKEMAEFLAESKAKVIVCGGDTTGFVDNLGLRDKYYLVSTGGGASMILLEGKKLPAIEALENQS